MPRSAGLSLYLASRSLATTGRPRSASDPGLVPQRPDGTLAWFHIGPGSRPSCVIELARRFTASRAETFAVVTGIEPAAELPDAGPPLFLAAAPGEAPRDVKQFFDHWRPDAAVFAGDVSLVAAMAEAPARNLPLVLVEARVPQTLLRRFRWTPGAAASLFRGVSHILTATSGEAETFRRLRAPGPVEARGLLEEGTAPLACNQSDHAALARLLAARPVWLAQPVEPGEIGSVLAAHHRASRLAHRLLLILAPADPASGPELRGQLQRDGWKVALRSDGDEPDPEVQVFVADTPNEAGLWYRLAPITFLGRSLVPGGAGHDPCEPAALGSAILTGPETGRHRPTVRRFLAAGAARTVGSAEALGEAVADLLAPDRAAEMARRAWEITSSGAEVTDRTLDLLATLLDGRDRA